MKKCFFKFWYSDMEKDEMKEKKRNYKYQRQEMISDTKLTLE